MVSLHAYASCVVCTFAGTMTAPKKAIVVLDAVHNSTLHCTRDGVKKNIIIKDFWLTRGSRAGQLKIFTKKVKIIKKHKSASKARPNSMVVRAVLSLVVQ